MERFELQRNVLVGVVVVLLATLVMVSSRREMPAGQTSISGAELERILKMRAVKTVSKKVEPVYPPPPDRAGAYFAYEVDEQALPSRQNRKPPFPNELRGHYEDGVVLLEFVVDTTGYPAKGSVRVIQSTHPDFMKAALIAFISYRFSPASIAGKKVPQHARLSFRFSAGEREP